MRDLLDKIQSLFESTGLAGRKPGDAFKNPNGDKITFKALQFYPVDGGKLDQQQLNDALKQVNQQAQIIWQNNKTIKTGGYAIATFDTPEGEVHYGFYKDNIKPDPTDNYIPNQVGEYRFAGKSAEKVQSGLTPQDLLTQRDNLTSEQIIQQLSAKLGENNILVQVATKVAQGDTFPITFPTPEGVSFSGFRDYFCEILQPMALQTGQYKGNAGAAAEVFLGGSYANTTISFDAAKNAGLSDSIMTNSEGKSIKISTKGGYGAQASAKNLITSIDELNETDAGKRLIEKYSDTINLIREIQHQGQYNAPLWLGVKYNVITDEEAEKIKSLKGQKPINLQDVEKLNLGTNLTQMALKRGTKQPTSVNIYYHLLANVAHEAADKVNSKTDFGKAASDILNNGALVQVYTNMKQKENEWVLEVFKTKWPSNSVSEVSLSASKNYFSTGVKGNFTFKINPTSKDDSVEVEPAVVDTPDLAKASKEIIDRPKRKAFKKDKIDATGVGRTKRK